MQAIQIQKPEDKFKSMILGCLERAIVDDTDGNRQKFNKSMKHFLRLVSPRMKAGTRDGITAKEKAMRSKLEEEIKGKTKDDVKELTTTKEYEFYDEIEFIGIHTLFNSGMFPKETGATLTVGKTMDSLNAVGEIIRDDKDIHEVEESEEEEYAVPGDPA